MTPCSVRKFNKCMIEAQLLANSACMHVSLCRTYELEYLQQFGNLTWYLYNFGKTKKIGVDQCWITISRATNKRICKKNPSSQQPLGLRLRERRRASPSRRLPLAASSPGGGAPASAALHVSTSTPPGDQAEVGNPPIAVRPPGPASRAGFGLLLRPCPSPQLVRN